MDLGFVYDLIVDTRIVALECFSFILNTNYSEIKRLSSFFANFMEILAISDHKK